MKTFVQSKVGSRKSKAFRSRGFFGSRPSERGIALVITLILLSVTLVMALAFLAISHRERNAVATSTDTATARLAADSALANAEAQIIANALSATNPYNYNLLVSTNYIPPTTFNNLQDLANLQISPRAPVFVITNQQFPNAKDNRFYLDLNRNGMDDPNGYVVDVDNHGAGANLVFEVGDPEWIGVLERPDVTHGPNNQFLSRYAFIAMPVGNTLDLNAIHNQVFDENNGALTAINPPPIGDNYFRNQGVGSWEINLAAFLGDLNTNEWGQSIGAPSAYYQYNEPANANIGFAFEDARALLAYRYANNYNTLESISQMFGANGALAFQNDNIDGYSDGPLQTTLNTNEDFIVDKTGLPWAGANNTNQFFDLTADLFDTTKTEMGVTTPPGFTEHLQQIGTNNSTYNRYTFYRLLGELGTDSTPESGKMNLNYDNLDLGSNGVLTVNGTASATNFVPWTPLGFFTNAADRMLRLATTNWFESNPSNYLATYYNLTNYIYSYQNAAGSTVTYDPTGRGLTNTFFGWTNTVPAFGIAGIPVLVNGQFAYSSAINRVLQLAANIYDANYFTSHSGLPSVFQPMFYVTNGNVYVTNFVEIADTTFLANTNRNLNGGSTVVAALQPHDLVFGVPLIIGVKKGFPNFNEFAMQSGFQLTRKLQVTRTSTNALANTYKINQMFLLGVTNNLGVECWNSYSANYTRPVNIYVTDYQTVVLTNDEGCAFTNGMTLSGTNINPITLWSAYNTTFPAPSFQIPLNTNVAFVPTSIYRFNDPNYPNHLSTNLALTFESNVVVTVNGVNTSYPQPNWGLTVANDLQVVMVDQNSGRIIDYVQLGGPNSSRNLSAEIQGEYNTGNLQGYNGLWQTTLLNSVPNGINNQVGVSLGLYGFGSGPNGWDSQNQTTVENEIDGFRAFYHLSPQYNNAGASQVIAVANSTNVLQLPYTPTAVTYQHVTWQANDPLVHYLASDLNTPVENDIDSNPNWPGNIGLLNDRYMPWGGNPKLGGADQNPYNLALKDPLVKSSDYWDFPTYKFPTVGWLGRVHRGTPWQTVYLKATNILSAVNGINTWTNWTGNLNIFDAINAAPDQDRLLFDLFTTAPNDNATRGQLSVNIGAPNFPGASGGPNLAAWSALFSGIFVPISPTNSAVINPAGPAGTNSALGQLVQGINNTRANFAGGVFKHVGDILAVPQLAEQSPFLTPYLNSSLTNNFSDEIYEWLPQQTLSLLRVSSAPRYVIYSYGQTLRPAQNSVAYGSGFFGMVTNYQVVAETATRAVVRVENAPTPENPTAAPRIVIESLNVLPPN